MKRLFIILFTFLMALPLLAETWTDANGVTWTFNVDYYSYGTPGIVVTGASGYSENLVIPDSMYSYEVAYPVKELGGLGGDTTILSVTLPSCLIRLANYAFNGCSNLQSINLENCQYLNAGALQGTGLTSVDLSSCKILSGYVFRYCPFLQDVTLSTECTHLDWNTFLDMFENNRSLEHPINLHFQNTLEDWIFSTYDYAFNMRCHYNLYVADTLVTNVTIDYDREYVHGLMFSTVQSVYIPNQQTLSTYAFEYCDQLQVLNAPNCINMNNNAINGCNNLKTFICGIQAVTYEQFQRKSIEYVSLPNCTSVGNRAFFECSSLREINLPVCKTIGDYAFCGAYNIDSISLPNCTSVGRDAFTGHAALKYVDLPNCISLDYYAFSFCENLQKVNLPKCQSVGGSAFFGCYALDSISLPKCKTIDYNAFSHCESLDYIELGDSLLSLGSGFLNYCDRISSITIAQSTPPSLGSVLSGSIVVRVPIASLDTFRNAPVWCDMLTQIIPIEARTDTAVTVTAMSNMTALYMALGEDKMLPTLNLKISGTINSYDVMILRNRMKNLQELDLSDATIVANAYEYYPGCYTQDNTIGKSMFDGFKNIRQVILPNNLEAIAESAFSSSGLKGTMVIPASVTSIGNDAFYNCVLIDTVVMQSAASQDAIPCQIGSCAFQSCSNLRSFTMSDQVISIGSRAFENCSQLTDARLSESLQQIGYNAFLGCSQLRHITLPESLLGIGASAFQNSVLDSITIPKNVTIIGSCAFWNCSHLSKVRFEGGVEIESSAFKDCAIDTIVFPRTLRYIRSDAFWGNTALKAVTFNNGLQTIEGRAFYGCSNLQAIDLPSSITSIGNQAFVNTGLRDVYVKLVDPFTIGQNTFNTWATTTLHVPMNDEWNATYFKYFLDTQWSQFRQIVGYNPTFTDFYLDNDYELNQGTIAGETDEQGNVIDPNADFNKECGFIVSDEGFQHLTEGHLKVEGNKSGSLIGGQLANGDANLQMDRLYCDIAINSGRWYFFAFPFDVRLADISCKTVSNPDEDAIWVFRKYDGAIRAQGRGSSWQNLEPTDSILIGGNGYIFQANANSTLSIRMLDYRSTVLQNTLLVSHAGSNPQDANWNFVGNPYLSYYQLDDISNFNAPVTIWNGSGYDALRPGDDDYTFTPFQAFFVQKPDAVSEVGFDPMFRETYQQSQHSSVLRAMARATKQVDPSRRVLNLTLSDGTYTDKTRVVYNDAHALAYEPQCDATKFFSTEAVPQLYTIYDAVEYAINERPLASGEFQLAYKAAQQGELTLSAARMDVPVVLYDRVTGIIFDLAMGDYTFTTEAGEFRDRFIMQTDTQATGIADVMNETGVSIVSTGDGLILQGTSGHQVSLFTLTGQQVTASMTDGLTSLPAGVYVVQVDDLSTKTIVR